MLTADQLAEAERRGIISADQRGELIALARAPAVETSSDDGDESFRLVGGGNDVFVGVGIVLLMAGAWSAITAFLPASGWHAPAIMAVFVWGFAEFITRRRRMKFSSLILAAAFILCAARLVGIGILEHVQFSIPENPFALLAARDDYRLAGWLACAGMAAVAVGYFVRFRVPFMAAVIAVSGIGLVVLVVADLMFDRVLAFDINIADEAQVKEAWRSLLYLPLLCGLLIFATGVALDLKDRQRETVWSDCAFWLHIVSAPLLVHPLFVLATGQNVLFDNNEPSASATVILLAMIAVFFYIALAIDRRSLLVPSLGYFGTIGIYYLVNTATQATGIPSFAVILAVIGALIVVFGAGWQRIRALVVGTTMPHLVLNKLPPMSTA